MIKPMYVGYAEFSHPSWLGLVCRHATAHHHMAAPAHSGVYRWQMRANCAEGTVSQRQVAYPFFCVVQLRTALVMTPYCALSCQWVRDCVRYGRKSLRVMGS